MNLIMNDDRLVSVTQLEAFLKGVDGAVDFHPETKGNKNKQRMYQWIEHALSRLRYHSGKKRERGIILSYLAEITRLSRVQLKRLVIRKKMVGTLLVRTERHHRFATRYSTSDIARLIETDNLHERLSGKATKAILEREWQMYAKKEYERIQSISVSHIYNLRETRQYISQSLTLGKTHSVSVPIGTRKKPQSGGKPGYLRVDSVHQGDLEKLKGVYHINLVDEVTQFPIPGGETAGNGETLIKKSVSEEFLNWVSLPVRKIRKRFKL